MAAGLTVRGELSSGMVYKSFFVKQYFLKDTVRLVSFAFALGFDFEIIERAVGGFTFLPINADITLSTNGITSESPHRNQNNAKNKPIRRI